MLSRYRLNVSHEPVRQLLSEYKALNGIPQNFALNDKQRIDFENYAINEAKSRQIDVFDEEGYRRDILKSQK